MVVHVRGDSEFLCFSPLQISCHLSLCTSKTCRCLGMSLAPAYARAEAQGQHSRAWCRVPGTFTCRRFVHPAPREQHPAARCPGREGATAPYGSVLSPPPYIRNQGPVKPRSTSPPRCQSAPQPSDFPPSAFPLCLSY